MQMRMQMAFPAARHWPWSFVTDDEMWAYCCILEETLLLLLLLCRRSATSREYEGGE